MDSWKANDKHQFVDLADLTTPIESVEKALSTIQLIDPGTLDFVIDMKHIEPVQSSMEINAPSTNFNYTATVFNNVYAKCKYFQEVERQQTAPDGYVSYEDWFNYLLLMSHFGDAGVERIMRFSAMDERFDPEFTTAKINYIRASGYHTPSCHRLRFGPGQIKCGTEPMICGAG